MRIAIYQCRFTNPPSIMQAMAYKCVSGHRQLSNHYGHSHISQLGCVAQPVCFHCPVIACYNKMVQSDPWNTNGEESTRLSSTQEAQQSFEDNFQPAERLPDSSEYLQTLGEFQCFVLALFSSYERLVVGAEAHTHTRANVHRTHAYKLVEGRLTVHIHRRLVFKKKKRVRMNLAYRSFCSMQPPPLHLLASFFNLYIFVLCQFSSFSYVVCLEKRLKKLQKDANVVDQLAARREHCMENLLRNNITLHDSVNEDLNRLEEDFEDSRRRDLTRYLVPEQAQNSSELVHIINYDQLEARQQPGSEASDTSDGQPKD